MADTTTNTDHQLQKPVASVAGQFYGWVELKCVVPFISGMLMSSSKDIRSFFKPVPKAGRPPRNAASRPGRPRNPLESESSSLSFLCSSLANTHIFQLLLFLLQIWYLHFKGLSITLLFFCWCTILLSSNYFFAGAAYIKVNHSLLPSDPLWDAIYNCFIIL